MRLVVVAVILLGATLAQAEPDALVIRGKVKAVSAPDEGQKKNGVLLLVEVVRDDKKGTIILEIKKRTRVERQAGKERKAARPSDLKKGQQVEAVCSRIVKASEPPIAVTQTILVKAVEK